MSALVRISLWPAAVLAAALLCACSGSQPIKASQEDFGSKNTYSRSFPATDAQTCEAARRALLSQGYVINAATADLVNGRKNFQPDSETHVQIEVRIVCAPEGPGGQRTIAFVNALQDRYAIKKNNTPASLGVGAIGSLSLPFSSSNDSLVKVASETIATAPFYDRFFTLLSRYLAGQPERSGGPEPPIGDAASGS
jgi:Uncharacterized protein conserved in bacteria (DUF2242)